MDTQEQNDIVTLDPEQPFWERFYMVAPLVVIGTRNEAEGDYNLAPKHMAAPMGWADYFGFVCTPKHKTYRNAVRHGTYTVSYPKPSQVVLASLAASPRVGPPEGPKEKPSLDQMPTLEAQEVDGVFLEDAYLFLECELDRRVDDLGENSLLIGKVKAVHVQKEALRISEQEDGKVIRDNPLLAYLPPDRYAAIDETNAFPFPAGFQK
jgi:flavin reductase (DIM6/NTAB) family NADH-FMN oxidoreductase RutF